MNTPKTPIPSLPLPLQTLLQALTDLLKQKLPPENPKRGRPKTYSDLHLLLFHLLRALLGWPTERLRRELARNPRLMAALGLPSVPSSATLSERSPHLPWKALLGPSNPRRKGIRVLALDSTLLPASRGDPGGGWGKDSRGRWVYGYKLHLLLDLDTGEVLGLAVTPAGAHDSPVGRRMLARLPRMVGKVVVVADSAYDGEANFLVAEGRGVLLLTGHNRRRGGPRGERRRGNLRRLGRGVYRGLLRRRWGLETVFGLLKGPMGLLGAVGRVMGLERVGVQVWAWVLAFSLVAQVLSARGLGIGQVLRAVA